MKRERKKGEKHMNADVDPMTGLIPPRVGEVHSGADLYRECMKRRAWRKKQAEAQMTAMECDRTRRISRRGRRS